MNEGWRKMLVAKLCKFGEILKLLHLVLMLWKWHHCWIIRSVWKCWRYMHDFVHKPMGIYLVVWYLKWPSHFESYRHHKQSIATILTIQCMLTILYFIHEIHVICNSNIMAAILKFKLAAKPNNTKLKWHRSFWNPPHHKYRYRNHYILQ